MHISSLLARWRFVFVVVATFAVLPAVAQAQFTTTTNNGNVTITSYTGAGGAVTIPATINGLPVTSIDDSAFFACANVTSVTIPGSVVSIGNFAFYHCTQLTGVAIPNSATSIGTFAFEGCTALTSVSLSNNLTSIGDGVFQSCTALTSVTIPTSVTSIGVGAFYGTRLTRVTIPASLTSIGVGAFSSITSLISVTLSNGVINIGGSAFAFCTGLTSVTIPASVSSIGASAFANCGNLLDVFFLGNAPSVRDDTTVFDADNGLTTIYHLPGTTGWGATFDGINTALLTTTPSNSTIKLSNLSQTYNGTAKAATVKTNPVGLIFTITYNGSTTPPVNAGSYAVVATVTDPFSPGKAATGTLVIAKGAQTITFGNLTPVKVGDAPFGLGATASSGLTVTTYASSNTSVATVVGGAVFIVGKGTTTITASQAGDSNYNAAVNVARVLTVNQSPAFTTQPINKTAVAGATATFTAAAGGQPVPTYRWQRMASGGSSFVNLSNSATYSGVTTTTLSVKGTTVAMSGDQFQCVATNSAGNTTSNAVTLTVNKAPATVALSGLTQLYTGTGRVVTVATVPASLSINVTYNGTAIAPVIPGNYAVTATVTEANHFGSANATLVIKPSTSTITLSKLTQTHNGTAKTPIVTTNPAGLAFNITYNGSTTAPINIGSYVVVATVTDPFSPSKSVTGTMVITKGIQAITFGALTPVKVGDAPFSLGATASSGLTVAYTSSNASVATVSDSTVTIVGKGTATITASQAGDSNYNAAANVARVLTVNQTPAFTTQPANKTVAAGATATFAVAASGTPAPTYQWQRMAAGGSSFVNLSNGTNYAGATTATLSVKGTTVAMSGDQFQCVATNVAGSATSNPVTLTVNKAPATVVLSGLTQSYTGTGRTVIVTTVPASLAVNVTYNGTTTAPIIPGNYAVVATVTEANHVGSANATLVIKPSTSTITLSNLSQTYNGTAKTPTVTTSPAGLAFNITYNGSTTPPVNAGNYTVVATVTDPFSPGKPATGTLAIAKAAQTITFAALPTQTTNSAPFSLGASSTSGLTVTYTSSNISVALVTINTVIIIGKGTTTITASQAGDANHKAAANVARALKVNPVISSPSFVGVSVGASSLNPSLIPSPPPHLPSHEISNITTESDANITSFTVESFDSAVWVSGIDPASTDTPSSTTAADLPALLLDAMNLNTSSPIEMLPTAAIEIVDNVPRLTLRYRQRAILTTVQMAVQFSTDLATWTDVPTDDITPLTNADDTTQRWQASVVVPADGPVYLRLDVSPSP